MRTTGKLTAIHIPAVVRSNEPIRAPWANRVRDCLRMLRDRGDEYTTTYGKPRLFHPFQLLPYWDTTTPKLRVAYGTVLGPVTMVDSSGDYKIPGWQANETTLPSGGGMVGNPSGTAVASFTLAASTTYGVWLNLGGGAAATGDATFFSGGFIDTEVVAMGGAVEVSVDDTNTSADDMVAKVAAAAGSSYFFVGSVAVGVAVSPFTIAQWVRSDVFCPFMSAGASFVSQDADNAISLGTDNGLWVNGA